MRKKLVSNAPVSLRDERQPNSSRPVPAVAGAAAEAGMSAMPAVAGAPAASSGPVALVLAAPAAPLPAASSAASFPSASANRAKHARAARGNRLINARATSHFSRAQASCKSPLTAKPATNTRMDRSPNARAAATAITTSPIV